MAGNIERISYRTNNVSVTVPARWFPHDETMQAITNVSQLAVEKFHLNFGRGKVVFIEDATVSEGIHVRTRDRLLTHSAEILVHPNRKHSVSGPKDLIELSGSVAAAVAVTRYLTIRPFASERDQQALAKRAQRVARDIVNSLKKQR